MARKRKGDTAGALFFLLVIGGIGVAADAFWKKFGPLGIYAVFATIILAMIAVHLRLRLRRRKIIDEIRDCVAEHRLTLARKHMQLVQIDSYGLSVTDRWEKELGYFGERIVMPRLLSRGFPAGKSAELWRRYVITDLEPILAADSAEIRSSLDYSDGMTPAEFEIFCAGLLQRDGWSAEVTPTGADQGLDVLARKGNVSVAIQCKKWRRQVGNSAVQEIVAAKRHYAASHAVVVSNSTYTLSAVQLAQTNGVHLLHWSELGTLSERFSA